MTNPDVAFNFHEKALTRLDELVTETDSKERANIVQKALALFDHVYKKSKSGDVIVRLDKKGNFR